MKKTLTFLFAGALSNMAAESISGTKVTVAEETGVVTFPAGDHDFGVILIKAE